MSQLVDCELAIDSSNNIDQDLFANDNDEENCTEPLPQRPKKSENVQKIDVNL